ncbi:hypothetical protein FRB90_010701 [Tulasnella sp. 427]|nr:hypothetical protein FRB90_010701 [Tulasnella sp. 427]
MSQLLPACWSIPPGQRPTAANYLREIEKYQAMRALPLQLPDHLYIAWETIHPFRLKSLHPPKGFEPTMLFNGRLDRSYKPSSVLVDMDGRAKIANFSMHSQLQQLRDSFICTENLRIWCSYEIFAVGELPKEADIWSWACIAIKVVCGQDPYAGHPVSENPEMMVPLPLPTSPEPEPTPKIPTDLLQLIRECWAAVPWDRPSASRCLSTLSDIQLSELSSEKKRD